jgi:hypothetical protein
MMFEKVSKIPSPRVYHTNLKEDLIAFYNSNIKIARITFNGEEYAHAKSAAECVRAAVKRHCLEFPNGKKSITVVKRGDNVYLVNNDIP